jgi:hypothetical protein
MIVANMRKSGRAPDATQDAFILLFWYDRGFTPAAFKTECNLAESLTEEARIQRYGADAMNDSEDRVARVAFGF